MDFNDIPNFRPLTEIRTWPAEPELPAVVRAENSARSGRDSSNRRPSASPQNEDFADLSVESPSEAEPAEVEPSDDGTVDFFA
jgi:hypothetical protein